MSTTNNNDLLDPKIDYVFKRIFTAHPDALVHLINDLRPDMPKVVQITILNPEITPEDLSGKNIVMDLLVEDETGRQYNIEMQVRNYNNTWNKRGVYYLAKLLAAQLKAGETYATLKGAVAIHLLDFDLFKDTEQQKKQALWRFEMRDGLQPDVKLGDDLQLNIIEMKKADRLGVGGQSIQDWITLFEHWKEDEKMSAITNPAVKEVRGYIRELSADERERQRAEARMKAIRDEASLIEDAERRGLEKGRTEGEAMLFQRMIQRRYKELPAWAQDKINTASKEQLEAWADRLFIAQSLDELLAD